MDKYLETYSLSKLNQEESEILNRQMTPSEIEGVIKKIPNEKSPGLHDFIGQFFQTFQELTLLLLKLIKLKRREGSQTYFMRSALS